MKQAIKPKGQIRALFAALLCLCLVVWGAAPSFSHDLAGGVIVAEMESDHGHSHGEALDAYWAFHGHSHDVVDHDHSSAVLVMARAEVDTQRPSRHDVLPNGESPPSPVFLLERPPRV
ncbi:hypothetical protein NNA36_05105 [Shimia sp. CNT1-13L.2]|uniref:hypothetical protein n=1 Tax=Shimia sp. CNT1-13L.2 TaxID=2959663 RepID=UPI0020CBC97F|nr:hypothetical protein [Shimia sp. CNT1-13L.2]MCP9481332.1 hypothetical protein [Shimia sp. CNT1-13L.2]